MESAPGFLLAAKRCEIHGLEQLTVTAELVGSIGRLVHVLQKERGASNVYLGSGGTRFAAQRLQIISESAAAEAEVRQRLYRLDTDSGRMAGGARLFSRIAWVLHGLDALPELRERIAAQALGAAQVIAAYSELIAGLLAVVFEAADTAADPAISRALVALFNFMQGKELAGQERATGAAAFAAGRAAAAYQQRLLHLIDAQERCFQVFAEFADPDTLTRWGAQQSAVGLAELERLRRVLCAAPDAALDADLADVWFDCCSRRLDAMRTIEDALAAHLQQLCIVKLGEARADLQDHKSLVDALAAAGPHGAAPVAVFFERAGGRHAWWSARRRRARSAARAFAAGDAAGPGASPAGDERRTQHRARRTQRAQGDRARQGAADGAPRPQRGPGLPAAAADGDESEPSIGGCGRGYAGAGRLPAPPDPRHESRTAGVHPALQ